jgi:hypothetical protein
VSARQAACPDCAVTPDGQLRLIHHDSCPHRAAEEDLMRQDRDWFRAHPGKRQYVREITPVEVSQLRLTGALPDGFHAAGTITVVLLGDGLRARSFADVWMYLERAA